jgi:type III secretion protein D
MFDTALETSSETLVLKVLAGRARGASAPLGEQEPVDLGHGFDADIVLRDPSAKGIRARLTAREDAADLEILEGRAEMLGHVLAAPARAVLPFYVPLLIGDNAVAIGLEGSPRWAEAERLLATVPPGATRDVAEVDHDYGETIARRLFDRAVTFVRGTPHLVPGLVFGAALACVTYAAANAPIWSGPHASAGQVHALLREEGYGALAVKSGEGDKLVIAGVLNREADKDRLRQIVDARDVPARIEVQTSESLAQNVEDVFMANGLAATARPNGLARVQVQVTGPADEVAKVRKVALTDVRGLRALDISRADGGGDRFGKVFDEGPGKRVVSVVGGDAGYVATADGARYFAGAMLPTGDRIVAVESQAVTVEKGGAQTKLMF